MDSIVLIVFLPLVAAIVSFGGKRYFGDRGAQLLTSGAVIIASILSWLLFFNFIPNLEPKIIFLAQWGAVGDFVFDWALRLDSLSLIMLLVVTSISAAVHVYSIAYMHHDRSITRFMAYLSLFTFFMLALVTSDNLIQLFFGWEGVGLASYLLIGFWYDRDRANRAAMKAFLVNRVGDIGFALGIFAIYVVFGSVEFTIIFAQAENLQHETLQFFGQEMHAFTIISLLLFLGAMGKSAQLGLHTWLPDAMEGPTPVSALIHAATMVTAGVFMLCRLSPLLEYSDNALAMITIVGAATAFFAGTVALVQNDIKRVIAYSTCSQLGYMFFAIGVSAYPVAMFHLLTHAFFKALLFLGAGSVIHAIGGEQDMRKMGGLCTLMPMTYLFMVIGSLSLMGIPFFAGYYSKDLILEVAWGAHSYVGSLAFWVGIAVAFLTALYSVRLLIMTFHGVSKLDRAILLKVHEVSMVILVPLACLALGAIFSGIWFYDLMVGDLSNNFWGKAIFIAENHHALENAHHVNDSVKRLPVVIAILGALLGIICYKFMPNLPKFLALFLRPLYMFLFRKWYFDEIYQIIFVKSALKIGALFWWSDKQIIDRIGADGTSKNVRRIAQQMSWLQSGYVYHYAFAMLIGIVVFVGFAGFIFYWR